MKYIKNFESRYKSDNINKKYYIWKAPNPYTPDYRVAIIEIINSVNKQVYYDVINKTGGYRDFFTHTKDKYIYREAGMPSYKVSLSYWKTHMITNLLYETNSLDDAKLFYSLYTKDNSVNRDNFEIYKNAIKYNL